MKTNRPIKNILRLALNLCLAVAAGAASARAANYIFTIIDHPLGIKGALAFGINSSSVVTGYYLDAKSVAHGYLLRQGVFEAIAHPLGVNGTYPRGVNDAEAVVGNYYATNGNHGFIFQNGNYTTLDYPLASSTIAYGISSSGEVVGSYSDGSVVHGFRFKDGVFTTIDNPLGVDPVEPDCGGNAAYGVNASGVVVGEWDALCGNDPYQSAYLLKDGAYTTINHPSTHDLCFAIGINDSGAVVGWFEGRGVFTNNTFFVPAQSYVLKNGVYTELVHPLFPSTTRAQAINAGGQVVGFVGDFSSGTHGFIATPIAIDPQELRLFIGRTGDTFQLTATGTTNTQWRLEFRDTLTGTNAWQPLTNITLGASPVVLDQPLASTSRFYRGISLP